MQSAQVFPVGKLARGLAEAADCERCVVKLQVIEQSAQVFQKENLLDGWRGGADWERCAVKLEVIEQSAQVFPEGKLARWIGWLWGGADCGK